jgi:hypothetical protein
MFGCLTKSREPSLESMLADPIVHALMAADGVNSDEVKALLRLTQQSIASRASAATRKGGTAFPHGRHGIAS